MSGKSNSVLEKIHQENKENLEKKAERLFYQLKYLTKPYIFIEELSKYEKEPDELHRYLFSNTSLKPSSFKASINIARGIINQIAEMLSNYDIEPFINNQTEKLLFDNKLPETQEILDRELRRKFDDNRVGEMILDSVDDFDDLDSKKQHKIYDKIYDTVIKLLYDASSVLKYTSQIYEKYIQDKNLLGEDDMYPYRREEISVKEAIKISIKILFGVFSIILDISSVSIRSVIRSIVDISSIFIENPNLENLIQFEVSPQTKLDEF